MKCTNQKDNRMSFHRSKLAHVNSTIVSELLYSYRIKISIEFFGVIPCSTDLGNLSTLATYGVCQGKKEQCIDKEKVK